MRAWKGLKTAMGSYSGLSSELQSENLNLIIYTPEADSAREKSEKDGRFSGNGDKKSRIAKIQPEKMVLEGRFELPRDTPLAPQASASAIPPPEHSM